MASQTRRRYVAPVLALLVSGCAGEHMHMPTSLSNIDIHMHPAEPVYVILAFEQGDVTVEMDGRNAVSRKILELVEQGYYNGSFIHQTVPSKLIQFGEAYWQGREPSPRWLAQVPPRPVAELGGSTVALQVFAQPTSQTMIVGPQMVITRNYMASAAQIGSWMVPIGKVVAGDDVLASAQKGDKITSAVQGIIAK